MYNTVIHKVLGSQTETVKKPYLEICIVIFLPSLLISLVIQMIEGR